MFIAQFLAQITQTPKFDFTLEFMEDKDRGKINTVIDNLTLLDENFEAYKIIKQTF